MWVVVTRYTGVVVPRVLWFHEGCGSMRVVAHPFSRSGCDHCL